MNVKFGAIADLHTEFIFDGAERMERFLETCRRERVDFCIQLGDFCPPGPINREHKESILSMLDRSGIPFYHVIGNHDTDENSKSDVLSYIGAPDGPLSFDRGGVHFVILDACYYREGNECHHYDKGNYRHVSAEMPVLPAEELDWLREDLSKAEYPSVIFSHQSLVESRTGIRNTKEFRCVAESAPNGVALAVCGHEHVDRLEFKNGVAYYCLNSASYYWAGSKYAHSTYGGKIETDHPMLRNVFPYKDPLFAIFEMSGCDVRVTGTASEFVGDSPSELGFNKRGLKDMITPTIKDRAFKIL